MIKKLLLCLMLLTAVHAEVRPIPIKHVVASQVATWFGQPSIGYNVAYSPPVFALPVGITSIVGYDALSLLIVTGEPEAFAKLQELLNILDVEPKQVSIAVKLLTTTDMKQFKFTVGDKVSFLGAGSYVASPLSLFSASVQESKGVTVIEQSITTLSHRWAQLFVGESIPITIGRQAIFAPGGFVFNQANVSFLDVGSELMVFPQVIGDNRVTITLLPRIREVIGYNNGLPIMASHTINTTISIPDGQTLAIGGLVRSADSTNLMPLYSSYGQQSNSVFLVTPTIIR